MFAYLKMFGVLRLLLIAAALVLMLLTPEPGSDAARSGWEMIPTLIAPAMVPLVFMVLMFDFMMCRIRMHDDGQTRKNFRVISYTEVTTALILLLVWLPFFLAIGR